MYSQCTVNYFKDQRQPLSLLASVMFRGTYTLYVYIVHAYTPTHTPLQTYNFDNLYITDYFHLTIFQYGFFKATTLIVATMTT